MEWIWVPLAAYLLLAAVMFAFQRNLLYPGAQDTPNIEHAGLSDLTVISTEPEPGIVLTHWFHPPQQADGPVLAVFHGNAGHIGDRVPKLRPLVEAGFGLLLTGYRGYGGNPGRPTEAGLSSDARSVLDWLTASGVEPERTYLYGESLGTAVAVKMASERRFAGVILEAPPSSIVDVAQAHYWYLPVRLLALDRWDSMARIQSIDAPLFLFHGERDATVPLRFGRKLFDAALEPKQAVILPQGDHTNLLDFPHVVGGVIDFVRNIQQEAR